MRMNKVNEIILFETEDKKVEIPVSTDGETVWLSANQMALLFERDEKTVRKQSKFNQKCFLPFWR